MCQVHWICFQNLNTKAYGTEIVELFKSRGFNVDCAPQKRGEVAEQILSYLKANNDADFNIRLGTLILRNKLKAAKGNVQIAAQNYNGNSKNGIKYAYGKAVKNYYKQMNNKS